MESKKFRLGQHFTSNDDLKEKMKKHEKESFLNVWIKDSSKIKAERVKKNKIQQ